MDDRILERPPITRSELVDELRALGVRSGSTIMVHCSLSSMGYVIGGADTVVQALLDALGRAGTLLAMVGWEHDFYGSDEWPEAARRAYIKDPPVFDPAVSEAARDYGRIPERIRTWPGAQRSYHPEASFAAIGLRAEWIASDQPWDHPYGPGSPLAKLVAAGGDVVMLGAPLETITLLHHAEEIAAVADKVKVTYPAAIRVDGELRWREINDIDTSNGAFPYSDFVGNDIDAFEVIARDALSSGIGRSRDVGTARFHLFSAHDLVRFAVAWMERHFG